MAPIARQRRGHGHLFQVGSGAFQRIAKKELSYDRSLAGGMKDENVSISLVPGAVSWDATYHGIEFDGDGKPTMDDKRAPAKKPKGK